MPLLRYYITGHGLGHASRSCQVLRALAARYPEVRCEVVSDAAAWFLADNLPSNIPSHPRTLDVGVCQADSLEIRPEATLSACRALQASASALLDAEGDDLRRAGVNLVVTDVAALPCAAAAGVAIPAVILSNFTWDWIYEGFFETSPGFCGIVDWQRSCYRQACLGLRLPFYGEFPVAEVIDLPLVARHSRRPKTVVRQQLGIDKGKRLALLSFGGFGLQEATLDGLTDIHDWVFLAEPPLVAGNPALRLLPTDIPYPDLVNAADVVITKPGYGIVAECITHRTPVLYTSRGNFREQSQLIAGLRRYGQAVEIDNGRLRRGELHAALEQVLALPPPAETIAANGAEIAADQLARLLV
jgi:L-arabinokinase